MATSATTNFDKHHDSTISPGLENYDSSCAIGQEVPSHDATVIESQEDHSHTTRTKAKAEVVLTDQTNYLPYHKIILLFLGLSLCALVSSLDSVIVATTLPTISSAFRAGGVISWVPSAYLLTSTVFQPLYGRFSDIFGRKAALVVSMSVYIIGNLSAGFVKPGKGGGIVGVIVARGVAGAGGGGIVSLAQIIISDVLSSRERYRMSKFFC
jgi:Na+/melibiose symporter-like transporter